MTSPLVCAFDPSGPLRSTGTRLLIAALSVAVLGVGALLRPRGPAAPLTAPKEHSAPLIEEEVQRRAPSRGFSGLQDLGARLAGHAIAIPGGVRPSDSPVLDFRFRRTDARSAAGFGVVVSNQGHALTHATALGGRATLQIHTAEGAAIDARVIAFEPETGLVLLQLSMTPAAVPPIAIEPVQAGALAAIATRWQGVDTVVPVFVTEVTGAAYTFSSSGAPVAAGAPIFTLEGEVAAVAAGPDRPGAAYPVQSAVTRLRAAADAGRGNPPSLGIMLQPGSAALARAFGESAVIVSDVIEGGSAAAAGIAPGDALTHIGAVAVDSIATAQRAIAQLPIATETVVRVVRNRQPQSIPVVVGSALAAAAWPGRTEREARTAPEADAVLSSDQLRAAGISGDARLLAVNARPVASVAEARRELRRRSAVPLLYVQVGSRRFFTVLPEKP